MTAPALGLAALLVRRMAHDLAAPLAALSTLAGLRGADPLEAEAIRCLAGRLALFRAVFSGMPDGAPDSEAVRRALAEAFGGVDRVALDLAPGAPGRSVRAGLALALDVGRLLDGTGSMRLTVAPGGEVLIEAGPLAGAVPASLAAVAAGEAAAGPEEAGAAVAVALLGPALLAAEGSRLRLRLPAAA